MQGQGILNLMYIKDNKMKIQLANEDLKTMVSCINSLNKLGFTEDYKVTDSGMKSVQTRKLYKPEDIQVLNFYRFEGNSDPGDNAILYAIETKDNTRGTLVDAYGPYADSRVSGFMHRVEEITKKTDKTESL